MILLSDTPREMYTPYPKGSCPVCGKVLRKKWSCMAHDKEALRRRRAAFNLVTEAMAAHACGQSTGEVENLLSRALCDACWGNKWGRKRLVFNGDGTTRRVYPPCSKCGNRGWVAYRAVLAAADVANNVERTEIKPDIGPLSDKQRALLDRYVQTFRQNFKRLTNRRAELLAMGVPAKRLPSVME